MTSQRLIETVCVRVRACLCMWASGLAYVGLRGEHCILMQNYYCKPSPQHVPTFPADASHFVTPSIFSHDRKSLTNYIKLRHTYCSILIQALTAMRLVTRFPAQIETRRQESTLLSKSNFWRYFTRKMCVNNACRTSEGRGPLLSKNIISFAICQFVWHWGALSRPKLAPTNHSLPYLENGLRFETGATVAIYL